MNARVCGAVVGGVFLKARSEHELAKEKIPSEGGGVLKGLACVKWGNLIHTPKTQPQVYYILLPPQQDALETASDYIS
jgi:hypothetical protein